MSAMKNGGAISRRFASVAGATGGVPLAYLAGTMRYLSYGGVGSWLDAVCARDSPAQQTGGTAGAGTCVRFGPPWISEGSRA